MNKWFCLATIALIFSTSIPSVWAKENAKFTHVFDGTAYPISPQYQGAIHQFKVHVQGKALSELSIDLPEGVNITEGIEVTNQSGQKVAATISINDRTAKVVFSQPVAPETTILVSMRGVTTPGYEQTWQYHISVEKVGMSAQIPLGIVDIATYR
ncbi:DUF2808 domain-containing protein [Phormidium sp. LEGE 05292]|nr:DUF2808 domain-containing protein [Phormidium sp. LEGE 05292]